MRQLEEYSGTPTILGMALEHFGRVEYPSDGHILHHAHDHYEFCLVESGAVHYKVDDTVFAMEQGDMCITRPGEFHGMSGGDGSRPWILNFVNVRQMPSGELVDTFSSSRPKVIAGASDMLVHFNAILNEARQRGFASALSVHAQTVQLLVAIARRLRSVESESLTLPYSNPVILARNYISNFGCYATRLNDVARAAGISESRLSHVFKDETGGTVREHIREVVHKRACRMLEDGAFTVTEIAERLSFPSIACFSAFFRNYTGQPPTAYRKKSAV